MIKISLLGIFEISYSTHSSTRVFRSKNPWVFHLSGVFCFVQCRCVVWMKNFLSSYSIFIFLLRYAFFLLFCLLLSYPTIATPPSSTLSLFVSPSVKYTMIHTHTHMIRSSEKHTQNEHRYDLDEWKALIRAFF